jgi:hypothetical protein
MTYIGGLYETRFRNWMIENAAVKEAVLTA